MSSGPIDLRDREPYTLDQFRVNNEHKDDLEYVLLSEGEIESRVSGLAAAITREYDSRENVDLYANCVLKGAMRFFGALIPRIEVRAPVSEGVIRASRYRAGKPGSKETEVRWLDRDLIEGRDILVVEDIIDEGYTLQAVIDHLEEYNPQSIEVATLFDKVSNRKIEIDVKFTGFTIPDEFVVGYGLDYDERYRNLRHLAVLTEEARNA